MDTITRAEFDDRMERLATKKDLAELRVSTKKDLADFKAEFKADIMSANRRILAAIAPLPTKTEMQQAIALAVAPLATKVEMHEAIAAAVAPLATKADIALLATKSALQDAKTELHETIAAAVVPLASKAEIALLATKAEVANLATRPELNEGFAKVGASQDAIKKSIKDLTEFVEAGLTENEARLRDLEAKG